MNSYGARICAIPNPACRGAEWAEELRTLTRIAIFAAFFVLTHLLQDRGGLLMRQYRAAIGAHMYCSFLRWNLE
jgi:hypothetical protein